MAPTISQKKLSGLNTYQRPLLMRVRNLDPSIVLRFISSATRSHLHSRIEIMFERLRKSINQKWPTQKPSFTEANIHPVLKKRRAFVVTGGNAGFGFELCEILRSSGVTIYMASRSQASLLSHHLFYTSTFPTAKADQGRSRNQSHHLHLLNPQNRRQAQFPPSRSE